MPSIFISCVSNEFASYRDSIRRDLTRPNLDTKIQEDFIAFGGPTLEKLDEYIQRCEAVIHICGDMTGSMSNEFSIQYINNEYKDFGSRFPELESVLNGASKLSYTQWEAWLAIYHNKRLFVVSPNIDAVRDKKYAPDPIQISHQREHLNRLRQRGYYDEIHFNNEVELVKELYRSSLGDILNKIPRAKAINLPYQSIGSAFKGRAEDIKEIEQIFSNNAKNKITGLALIGLGGIGKTRLVTEYALKNNDKYSAILFVHASASDLLEAKITQLASPNILNLPEYNEKEDSIKYAAVIKWLNQYSEWLLIFDNSDTFEATKKVEEIFASLHHGHVLITTRLDNWSLQIKKKRIEVLNKEAAISFLLETTNDYRIKSKHDLEIATTICNELGYLSLALEQTRAYIVTKEMSLSDYYKKWEANRTEILGWINIHQTKYDASVAITWKTTFDQLSDSAIRLLNILSWMAPDPIPKDLLEIKIPNTEPLDLQTAWEELNQFSLVTSSIDKKSFRVHRLVQEITRVQLDKTMAVQAMIEAISLLNTVFEDNLTDVSSWPLLEPLIIHVLSIIEFSKKTEVLDNFTKLMNKVASIFYDKAKYNNSEALLRLILQIHEKKLGLNHPQIAIDLNNIAQVLNVTNRHRLAEPLFRKALNISIGQLGLNHPIVATELNNLALLLQKLNNYSEAETLFRKALEIDEEHFGAQHSRVASRLNNLAILMQRTNRLIEAESLMRRALEIDKNLYGLNHQNVSRHLSNLSQLLHVVNRHQESEILIRQALKIDEEIYGLRHPFVATDLHAYGNLLKETNRLLEAEQVFRRALEINELFFGENHPNVSGDLNNLAQILQDTNQCELAEVLLKRALEIDEKSFGLDHANVARDLNNLSILFYKNNRQKEAFPLMKRALEIDEKIFGSKHPDLATRLSNLGQMSKYFNQHNEAESLMRRALEIDEESFGENNPKVARDLNNLAQLLHETNRFVQAEPLLRRAFNIMIQGNGFDHSHTQIIFKNYKLLLEEMGKSQEEISDIIGTLTKGNE